MEEHWYVLKTRSNCEKKVAFDLNRLGYVIYLPLITELKQWSDRKKKVQSPLIKSTIFVFIASEHLNELYTIQGVHSILKFLGQPARVKQYEIDALKDLVNSNDRSRIIHEKDIIIGDTYEIIKGVFKGIHAQAVSLHGKFRVALKLETLGSYVIIDIPKSYLALVYSHKTL